eukprot:968835-Rhodomonas_salina.1
MTGEKQWMEAGRVRFDGGRASCEDVPVELSRVDEHALPCDMPLIAVTLEASKAVRPLLHDTAPKNMDPLSIDRFSEIQPQVLTAVIKRCQRGGRRTALCDSLRNQTGKNQPCTSARVRVASCPSSSPEGPRTSSKD